MMLQQRGLIPVTEHQVGFLCQSPDAHEADPDEPLWEIVIGEIRNDWTPNDPLQMPTRICCGQCDDDQWAPMVSVSRKIDLHMASYIADEFNKKFLGEGIRHWAVIFFDGDSPLSELRLSEDFQ
jgi:hypothetical protein